MSESASPFPRAAERRHQPTHTCRVVGIPTIGEGIENTRVNDDHRPKLPAKSLTQHLVSVLGYVGPATIADSNERRQRPTLFRDRVQVRGQAKQLVGLLIREALDELKQSLLAGHASHGTASVPRSDPRSIDRNPVPMSDARCRTSNESRRYGLP